MSAKTVVCCICGETVTKRKTVMYDGEKRCCRIHSAEIEKKKSENSAINEALKEKLVELVVGKVGSKISDLATKSEKNIDTIISSEYAECCKNNKGFSDHISGVGIKIECYKNKELLLYTKIPYFYKNRTIITLFA